MEWYAAGGLLLGCVVGGMALGFPVAITFMITNVIGSFMFSGDGACTCVEHQKLC